MKDIVERIELWLNTPSSDDPTKDAMLLWEACDTLKEKNAEIERLRAQVESAHNIIGSETMVWVFHGSKGWLQANLQHLRDPIHLYWKTYGNTFKEARRGRGD